MSAEERARQRRERIRELLEKTERAADVEIERPAERDVLTTRAAVEASLATSHPRSADPAVLTIRSACHEQTRCATR